jgi:hypothetical protein
MWEKGFNSKNKEGLAKTIHYQYTKNKVLF